jgi:hypothetical protein
MKSFASSALRSRADDDGNRRSVLLLALHVAHPAAPPTARPPAAAAATSRAKRAVAEVAGGGGGRRGSGGGLHQGGHGRRVLPDLRHQAHHALRRYAPKTLLPSPPMIPLSALKISNLRHCVQACATSATGASGSCGSTTPTGTACLLHSLTWCDTGHSISNCIQQLQLSC